MKTCCLSIVFLLYGNSSKQLALFFCSFRERTSAEFSKCFHTIINGERKENMMFVHYILALWKR